MNPSQDIPAHVAPEIARYADAVVKRLQAVLGDELLGAYLIGSNSLGGYEAGPSDIDIIAICARPVEFATTQAIARELDHRALPCPARGLEFVLYPKDTVSRPTPSPRFELNLNTGAGMGHRFTVRPEDESPHWFVIDLDIARQHGVRLAGPPAMELLAPQDKRWVLDAIRTSLTWHAREEPASANNVLNACRAWRHAEEGVWCTKTAAATWARERLEEPSLIDAALVAWRGQPGPALTPEAVHALVQRVLGIVERAAS
jgi:hypothetical protein